MNKLFAFLKRDLTIFLSYKMALVTGSIGCIVPLFSYFYVSKLVPPNSQESLLKYGGDYFSFLLIGIAATTYLMMALSEFSGTTRRDQVAGCLEALLSSQTGTKSIIFMSAIFKFIHNGTVLIIMFTVSTLFLGFNFSNINILSTVVTLILSLGVFISLGIISAAGTILFKRGEPFGFIFGGMSSILGGAVFPVSILPESIQVLSYIVPIKYSLDAFRLSILKGYSIMMLSHELIILLVMALILLPISLSFFDWAVEKGKKEGSLMHH